MRGLRAAAVVLMSALATGVAGSASADEHPKHKVHWDPAWGHSNAWDYTLGSLAATAFAAEGLGLQWHQSPLRWTDPILFDTQVRSVLRASSPDTRNNVDAVSWGLLAAQLSYPVAVDVPYAWARYGFGVARDLFWQDAVTLFFAGAVDFALRDLVGRGRPYVYDCIMAGGTNCVNNPEAVRSFPGGHILTATAGSVLTCTQHLYMRLYGRGWDAMTCALSLTSDVAVGFMRIIADSHWATDIIAGAAIGALIGWGVPYIMHFHRHAKGWSDRMPNALVLPAPIAFQQGGGLGVMGLF